MAVRSARRPASHDHHDNVWKGVIEHMNSCGKFIKDFHLLIVYKGSMIKMIYKS